MVQIPLAAIVTALIGGLIAMGGAIIGFQAKMLLNDMRKAIDTLFSYNDDLEKAVAQLRTDFEKLQAEHKVRHSGGP